MWSKAGWRGLLLLPILLAAFVPLQLAVADDRELLVFAAASLQGALDAAVAAYASSGGEPVHVSYAGSSTLARQIEQGAEADIFISANIDWMDYLQDRELIRPSTRTNLVGNALVLITSAANDTRIAIAPGLDLAGMLGDGRLAMGDPDHVPAGIYGREALSYFGVWKAVRDRLIRAGNARAALALVSRGEAPLGIVYRSDAVADNGVRVVDTFPAMSHSPIVYPLAVIASSTHPATESLTAFLQSAQISWLFARHGFSPRR